MSTIYISLNDFLTGKASPTGTDPQVRKLEQAVTYLITAASNGCFFVDTETYPPYGDHLYSEATACFTDKRKLAKALEKFVNREPAVKYLMRLSIMGSMFVRAKNPGINLKFLAFLEHDFAKNCRILKPQLVA